MESAVFFMQRSLQLWKRQNWFKVWGMNHLSRRPVFMWTDKQLLELLNPSTIDYDVVLQMQTALENLQYFIFLNIAQCKISI